MRSGAEAAETRAFPPDLPVAAWQEDLDVLYELVLQHHPDPFHWTSERALRREWRSTRGELVDRGPTGRLVAIFKLLALLRDAHTRVGGIGGEGGIADWLTELPIALHWYADGLYVRVARDGWQELLGARLVALGGASSTTLLDLLTSVVSHENIWRVRAVGPRLATRPHLLEGLGVTTETGQVSADFEVRGQLLRRALPAFAPGGWQEWTYAHGSRTPSTLDRSRGSLATFFLEGELALVMKYDRAADPTDGTLSDLFEAAFAELDASAANALVVDLRGNGGGDSRLNWPLVYGIMARPEINRPDRLFVLIGRETFSAAMHCVSALERHTNATFAGEPTGTSPLHFGDAVRHLLPNTRVPVDISTLWWQESYPYDTRASVTPDLPVTYTPGDYARAHDAGLARVEARLREAKRDGC